MRGLPNPRNRHESQPRLSEQSNDTSEPNTTVPPGLLQVMLVLVEDDKGKCMDQGKDEHGPANPVMPHIELLVRYAGKSRD